MASTRTRLPNVRDLSTVCILFALFTATIVWALPIPHTDPREVFNPEVFKVAGDFDSFHQRIGYQVYFGMLAAFALVFVFTPAQVQRIRVFKWIALLGRGIHSLQHRFAAGFSIVVFFVLLYAWHALPWRFFLSAVFVVFLATAYARSRWTANRKFLLFAALLLLGMLSLYLSGKFRNLSTIFDVSYLFASFLCCYLIVRMPRHRQSDALLAFIPLYFVFYAVPGFLGTPDITHLDPLWVEAHFTSMPGSGERLAAGLHLFESVRLYYGYLLPTVFAAIEKAYGEISMGTSYRVVQCLQLAFGVLALTSYWMAFRGSPGRVLVALALTLPWVHTSQSTVFFPNLSAWRVLGFAFATAVLLIARRWRATRSGVLLGASASLLVLFNTETGIAISCGFLVFLFFRLEDLTTREILNVALRFSAMFALGILMFAAAFRVCFGYWPIPTTVDSFSFLISAFSSGLGGFPFYFDPLAIWFAVHPAYIILRGCLHWRRRPLGGQLAFRMAVSTTLLVWLPYYINRFGPWDLIQMQGPWTLLYLAGFLLDDLFERRLLALARISRWRVSIPVSVGIGALIVAPWILYSNYQASREILRSSYFSARQPAGGELLSGVWLPKPYADAVRQKAEFVTALSTRERIIYFTTSCYLVPKLSRVYSPLPMRDPFSEAYTRAKFARLVSDTLELAPDSILFDAPGSRFVASEPHRRFYNRLKNALSSQYARGETVHGWEVWHRNKP